MQGCCGEALSKEIAEKVRCQGELRGNAGEGEITQLHGKGGEKRLKGG